AQGRSPERSARATNRRDERASREDQQLSRRRAAVRVKGLDDGLESPDHVGAVVSIADRRVELDQVVALGADGDIDLAHPGGDRGRVHDPVADQVNRYAPQRNAGVWTGASQSLVSSSSSSSTDSEAPAISRDVM